MPPWLHAFSCRFYAPARGLQRTIHLAWTVAPMVVALLIGAPIVAWLLHYPVVTPIIAIRVVACSADNTPGQAQ